MNLGPFPISIAIHSPLHCLLGSIPHLARLWRAHTVYFVPPMLLPRITQLHAEMVYKDAPHCQSTFTVSMTSVDSPPSCLHLIFRASILHLLPSPMLLVLLFALMIFHFGVLAIPTPSIDPTSLSFDCAHRTRTIWSII